MKIIEMKNVSKTYIDGKKNETHALKMINLSVENGDFISIKGSSGSGKSTLLHIIGCLDTPSSGEYYYMGRKVRELTVKELAEIRNKNIGFVLQDYGLIEKNTVMENIILPLWFAGELTSKEMRKKARDMLDGFGMSSYENKLVRDLSGGEKQRVAIARALVTNPSVIIADEPTGALDYHSAEIVMNILKEQNDKGRTIIIVTHDDDVAAICKEHYIMKYGELKKEIVN